MPHLRFLTLIILCLISSIRVLYAESVLYDPGRESIVQYEKYGIFRSIGTNDYVFEITDETGLKKAVGEASFPSESYKEDPAYQRFISTHAKVNAWNFIKSPNAMDDFYAWSFAEDHSMGNKQFYKAEALRRAGFYQEAIKAYYAIVVHFPRTVAWSADGSFYWYVAPEAIARIRRLCAEHPEFGFQLEGAFLDIQRAGQKEPDKDIVRVWPGKFLQIKPNGPTDEIKKSVGQGRVRLVQYMNDSWKLFVDDKEFFVKGVTYAATTIGESAHALNLRPWMTVDDNRNGKNDGMFDSWMDLNKNNTKDPEELLVGDAKLLKDMGANAIRVYHGVTPIGDYNPAEYDKELMRRLNREYGLFFIMGDFLGAYTVGSQADWNLGTDYTDPAQKKAMMEVVKRMVLDHKDEPYVLMWLLGNENQHPNSKTNADTHPKEFALFVNEIAKMIHELDPNHPVAVCNLNSVGLKEMAQYAPEVDIYGANVYSGAYSMGSVWQNVRTYYDKPVLITEMGCDAYSKIKGLDEAAQADYLEANWQDIEFNRSDSPGEGNAIGGVLFEWMDEWWKTSKGDGWGDPYIHNREADYPNAFPDAWAHEEWMGLLGQGNGSHSPYLREPRKAYFKMSEIWKG